jgi:hypothetical protein
MSDELKRIIVNQCGPVLLDRKPAALFTLRSQGEFTLAAGLLRPRLNLLRLRKHGDGGLLVLAFDKERLWRTLSDRDARRVLLGRGYPAAAPPFVLLDGLRRRFIQDDFPHEVGIFLGYPPEDVLGFVRHKGQNYKLRGYWKVYGDVERAKRCFQRYDACRERIKTLGPDSLGELLRSTT